MTDLAELIARVEGASEGSRALDAEIHESLGNTVDHGVPEDWLDHAELPPYSTSIDAALTLVPNGHQWSLTECAMPGRYYAELGPRKESVWSFDAQAATPALALVSACLKARLA